MNLWQAEKIGRKLFHLLRDADALCRPVGYAVSYDGLSEEAQAKWLRAVLAAHDETVTPRSIEDLVTNGLW